MDFCMGELIWDPNGAYLLFRSANRLQMRTVRGVPPPCATDLHEGVDGNIHTNWLGP